MKNVKKARYIVADELLIDLTDQRAFLDGVALNLSPKPFALLDALVRKPQMLVTKATLFEEVWNGLAVSDAVLTTAMKELRQALNDAARSPSWIETVHGKGYRFLKLAKYSKKPKYKALVQSATAEQAAPVVPPSADTVKSPVFGKLPMFEAITQRELLIAAPALILFVILAVMAFAP